MNVHSECNNKESNIYCHCSFFAEGNDYKITKFQDCKIRSLIVIKSLSFGQILFKIFEG